MQYQSGIKTLSANPPFKGVVTFWGKRITNGTKAVVVDEGQYLTMPYWPFYIDILPIEVTKINKDDVPIADIICKSPSQKKIPGAGGRITAFFSYTFTPDENRMNEYINSGEAKGVSEILENQISETIRQKGADMTWEEFQFSGDKLTAEMIVRLSGDKPVKLTRYPTDPNRVLLDPNTKKPTEITPTEKIEIKDSLPEEITYFLEQKVRGNSCYADIQDLGVIIHRANIERFELGADLRKAAENLAREEQEQRGELKEIETEIKQAQKLLGAYKRADKNTTMDLNACILEIRRRKAQREGKDVKTIEIPGLEKAAEAVATIFKGMKGGNP